MRKLFILSLILLCITYDGSGQVSLHDIPNQTTGIGGSFSAIDLNEYVAEGNAEDIIWEHVTLTQNMNEGQPNWSVKASDFQFLMIVTCRVSVFNNPLKNSDDLLAAFSKSTDELVGVASPMQEGNEWLFFMTLYSHTASDDVYFKAYEADHSRVINVNQELAFVANDVKGEPDNPVDFNVLGNVSVEIVNDSLFIEISDANWTGIETLALTARDALDPSQFDIDTVIFEILEVEKPTLNQIPDLATDEGEPFETIDLQQYLQGMAFENVLVELVGADTLMPEINGSIVSFTLPDVDYYGESQFEITVKNQEFPSFYDQKDVTLKVNAVNDSPIFTSVPILEINIDEMYLYEIEFSDIDSENVTINTSDLPSWLSFIGGNDGAVLFGMPKEMDAGTHEIVLTIDDGFVQNEQAFTIEVNTLDILSSPKSAYEIIVYPNPAISYLRVVADKVFSTEILDHNGKFIFSSKEKIIDFSQYDNGLYFLRFYDAKGQLIEAKKILVHK